MKECAQYGGVKVVACGDKLCDGTVGGIESGA